MKKNFNSKYCNISRIIEKLTNFIEFYNLIEYSTFENNNSRKIYVRNAPRKIKRKIKDEQMG